MGGQLEALMQLFQIRKIAQICIIITILLASTACAASGQTTGTASSAKKNVIFRCDDVAPKAKFAELQELDQVHINKNVPVTLGIVPHPMTGTGNELLADSQFSAYMKSLASNRLFEFAQHGYTHQNQGTSASGPSEFYGRPYVIQYNTIKQGREDIHTAFAVTPTSFIPPFDKGDTNTLKAAHALGFTEYSTSFRDFNVNQGSIQGMHVGAVSLTLANESLRSAEIKTNQFLADPHSIDTFVVLYHPADFSLPGGSVNKEKIKLLEGYIDYLKGRSDVQFTTLDHSWTTGGTATSTHPSGTAANLQQQAVTLPFGERGAALIGLLDGPYLLLLVGGIFALLLGVYVVLSRNSKRRRVK